MLAVSSSPIFCWKNVEGKKNNAVLVAQQTIGLLLLLYHMHASGKACTISVLKAFHMLAWMHRSVFDLQVVFWGCRGKPAGNCSSLWISSSLGEDNAFLPLSVDNQIRVLRRLLRELQRRTSRGAFSSGFVIQRLPLVLSPLVLSLCCATLLFHR